MSSVTSPDRSAALNSPANQANLRLALRELYSDRNFSGRVFCDPADHAYASVSNIERSVARLAPELTGDLLDVGCGQQPYASYFAHVARRQSCDFDGSRAKVDFSCPADRVPLADASLDSILCTEVLEHVPNPQSVWREFARLLRPGGKVLLATPMYWPSHEEPYDFFRYTGYGLIRLAEEAGFEVLKLYPRGGVWAFLAQAILHAMPQYMRMRWQRLWLNKLLLRIDRSRCNPSVTTGWTILARRR